jgi:hypothetical protein
MKNPYKLKRIFEICIIIIILTLVISCKKQPSLVHYCNLTIICDSTFNEHIYENVYLISDNDTIYVNGKNYKRGKMGIIIKFDSVPSKKYVLYFSNIFRDMQSQKLNLMNDTVISISNRHRYENMKIIPLAELLNADTIKLFYSYSGCYSHVESFNFISKNNIYLFEPTRFRFGKRLLYTRFISKTVPEKIVNGLFDLQVKSRKYMALVRNKKTPWKMSRVEYYILANNKVFMFDDENRCCEEFYKFSDKYIVEK